MEYYEKKYKEALERAKEWYNSNLNEGGKAVFEDIFPELKESEDETIRKFIKDVLDSYGRSIKCPTKDILLYEKSVAWLEKQREKKSINNLTQQEAMDIAVAKCFEQGKQEPVEWSEEDKKMLEKVIANIEYPPCTTANYKPIREMVDWLNFLKERYAWKPSDEQMKQLGWIAKQNKDNMIGKELMSLYQDLKKLGEE